MWDTILTELDSNTEKFRASVLCGIDFSVIQQMLVPTYPKLLREARHVPMDPGYICGFLTGRSIQVKLRNVLYAALPVKGGVFQGTVLGVMDHNVCMEGVDENFLTDTYKYVYDMTATN